MNQMYNKTDNPKRKAGRAVPLQDRHNHSFKSGLLSRLCCAALALLLAFGGVSALRGSFDGLLPVVHAEEEDITERLSLARKDFTGTWHSTTEMENVDYLKQTQYHFISRCRVYIDEGKELKVRRERENATGGDGSVVYMYENSELHLRGGSMTGMCDEYDYK